MAYPRSNISSNTDKRLRGKIKRTCVFRLFFLPVGPKKGIVTNPINPIRRLRVPESHGVSAQTFGTVVAMPLWSLWVGMSELIR